MTAAQDTDSTTGPPSVFSRVLVGIDGSPESSEAVRQAAALAVGELTLLAVYDSAPVLAATPGMMSPPDFDLGLQRRSAQGALSRIRNDLGERPATGKIVEGGSWEELLAEAGRDGHTLIAIGSHGNGRASGIMLGSTATELIHKAPCSVLVARNAGVQFPRKVVVGVDGSPQSAAAYAVARALAERFDAELWPVVAHGGRGVDEGATARLVGSRHEDLPDQPVRALVAAAADADLVVVGSRGLHGLRSLGSVSERVAHQAGSSVLIVREPV